MVQTVVILLIVGLAIAGILAYPVLMKRRRDRLQHRLFPPLWQALVEHNLPIYTRLSAAERRQLQGLIQVFLAEKQFIGCQGLQVSDEMRLTIAASACLLLLNGRGNYFPNLRSILIYPSAYFATNTQRVGPYVVEEERVARLGESWVRDQVVLAWDQVKRDAQNWQDGHNVVLHEFAHQLDQADGEAEGVPILPRRADYATWAEVMRDEYQQLCHQVQRGQRTVMNAYGATNPAEFFAVATETFFEAPKSLLKHHPALYGLLRDYYKLDPVQWV